MQIFEQTLARLHNYFLRKALPGKKALRSSMYLGNATTIGILFEATSPGSQEPVLRYADELKAAGKKVKLLAYFNHKQDVADVPFQWFNRKSLDWKLQPIGPAVLSFAEQPFDLLINLTPNEVLPLDYIAALSKAKFRAGPCIEKTFCYDLMIDIHGKNDLEAFIHQTDFYLKKLRSPSIPQVQKNKGVLEAVA